MKQINASYLEEHIFRKFSYLCCSRLLLHVTDKRIKKSLKQLQAHIDSDFDNNKLRDAHNASQSVYLELYRAHGFALQTVIACVLSCSCIHPNV